MKVSVIIPTFNRAGLVCAAIDSVLAQSFNDIEVVVIDDGSTDDTEGVLRRYGSAIRYVKQDNRGLNNARHRGLAIAQGEYIGLLDSDDLWCPFKAALDVALLDSHPRAALVFSDFLVLKPDGQLKPNGLGEWFRGRHSLQELFGSPVDWPLEGIPGTDAIGRATVPVYFGDVYYPSLFGPTVLPSASMYRRAMATGLRLNEQDPYCGDWEFFSTLSHQFSAIFVDHETAINRSHEDAVRLTRADPRLWVRKQLEMIERVWSLDAEFYATHQSAVDQQIAHCLLRLLKLNLRAGDASAARAAGEALFALRQVKLPASARVYKLLATTPGAGRAVQLLDRLRRRLPWR